MRLTLVLCVLVACGGDGGDGGGRGHAKGGWDRPEPVTVVDTVDVAKGAVTESLTTSAVVEAEASADLMSGANGMVLQVVKDVGDTVRRGDLLAVIDNASLDASAERTRSEVRHLSARYAEMQVLAERGAVSNRELEDVAYQLRTARTTAREASRNSSETRLTAPFDGVIAARDIRVGEMASGSGRAFQVVDLSALRVVASLPERDVSRVALGQRASLVSAYDETRTAKAVVTRMSPVIDAASGTFQITLTLDADQDALRPGQFVSVDLEVARREGVLVIPRDALLYENGTPVVYRMAPEPEEEEVEGEDEGEQSWSEWLTETVDSFKPAPDAPDEPEEEEDEGPRLIAERVIVEPGMVDTRVAEIRGGLTEGEAVITVGNANLREGARVRTASPEEPAPADVAGADDAAVGDEG